MAITAHAGGAPVARRAAPTPRRSAGPGAALAALNVRLALLGCPAVGFGGAVARPGGGAAEGAVEGLGGGSAQGQGVESSGPGSTAPTIVPTVQPLAPPV